MFRLKITILFLLTAVMVTHNADAAQLLFDQGHGQAFTIEKEGPLQLGDVATLFRDSGLTVQSSSGDITSKRLENVDALIISGAFRPYSNQEISSIENFIDQGGRVAILLHIAQPMWGLLDRLGVDVANGVIRETRDVLKNEPLNFRVTEFTSHPLTEGLAAFNLYGGWPLRPAGEHARTIALSSDKAWVDLNRDKIFNQGDAVQKFGIVVSGTIAKGEFLVFADDAIFQNRFLDKENRQLAENLGRWLAGK